eukprot:TRINITY_DN11663_c0_g1_i1.p1 TRINITY_DN11663_c0_g1~~TRINITY_DN11663_c0_g1_i1.p1  ORF type:complete len:352 (+),score=121.52 TRINITY_DN11663_c0_g1_i1:836-1891(+)
MKFAFALLLCLHLYDGFTSGSPINDCQQLPPHDASNVRDLSPSDVKVYMALGDSISAGFGIMGYHGGLNEFRGLSASGGADNGSITVGSFFRHFSADLFGPSYGKHLMEVPGEGFYANDVLNAAQSGATVHDFAHQIKHLYATLTANPSVNMTGDWKFVNVLVGANDACRKCRNPLKPSIDQLADSFEKTLSEALDTLHQLFPRTFVNVLPMFNASQIYFLTRNMSNCAAIHAAVPIQCPSAYSANEAHRAWIDSALHAFGQRAISLAQQWKAKNLTDFTVVYQPFFYNLVVPNSTYISTLDCFHPSLLAHETLAVAAWNSLLLPFASKPTTFVPDQPITCPTSASRLWAD